MQHVAPQIFRAYDVRGVYPGEVDEGTSYLMARAYAQYLNARKIVIGHDARAKAKSLYSSFIRGLVEEGVEVHEIGLASTPYLYFCVNQADYDGGVMITASHTGHAQYGFKLTRAQGLSLSLQEGLQEIYNLLSQGIKTRSKKPGKILAKDYSVVYVDAITKQRAIGNLKIAVDTGNGMAGLTIPAVLQRFPQVKVIPIYWEIDGKFPNHLANPLLADTLVSLKAAVKKNKCDFGVAYDSDGDRVGFVTSSGKTVAADFITILLARRQLRKHPGETVLYDLRSSWVVPEEIRKLTGEAIATRVGHAFIKREMRKKGAIFAGEQSMHYYFKDFYNTDNGDFAVLEILELLTEEQKSLDQLIQPLKRYFRSEEINLQISNFNALILALSQHYRDGEQNQLDGLSIFYPDWHLNIRASRTEPLVRLNFEAKNRELLKEKRKELAQLISPYQKNSDQA